MTLTEKVNADIATAMKAKDSARLSALRMMKAAIMNREVEKGRTLDDAEVVQVVSSLVKQRRDSIEQFTKGGRTDLVDKETAEIVVLGSTGTIGEATLDVAADLWPVSADEQQLAQVFGNVLLNAMQASPHGGAIDVRAENVFDAGERWEHALRVAGTGMRVSRNLVRWVAPG